MTDFFSQKILWLFFYLLLTVSSFTINAQTPQKLQVKIDSLQKVLSSLTDTARIDCLHEICVQYIFIPNDDSVLYYSSVVYEESKKINYIHGIALSFCPKAAIQNHQYKNFPEMEKLARESLKWFERTGNKKYIEVPYWQVGAALFRQYKYEDASKYLEQCYYWSEKNGNKERMFNVLGFKYENYRDIGEYDKAFEAFQKTQQLNLRLNGKTDSLYEFYILAELQRRLENYSTALDYYHKVIASMDLQNENIWYRVSYPELFALNGQLDSAQYYYNLIDSSKCNRHELRFYLTSLGEFYLLKKEYEKALPLLLQGLNYHREAPDLAQVNRALLDVAKTYAALHHDNDALVCIREGLDISIRSRSKQYIRDAYQILYDIYQRRHEPDSAFYYYQKYVAQKELVASDLVKGQFAAYNYEQQIALLDKEKQVQQQKISESSLQKKILLFGIIASIVIGFIVFRNIVLKRKNEANRRAIAENELLLQKVENEKTKAELEQQATELEMQALRAQMNPHFIFNSLNSINRFILQNNRAQASEYLTKFSKLVRMILQNSQASLITLESELEALKLYIDLEALRFEQHFDYTITVPDDMDIEILKVPPLIIQPYVENAIWHGLMHKEEKGHLEIKLFQPGDFLCCKITDDGVGRTKASELKSKSSSTHKSMGMQITASRIEMLKQKNKLNTSIEITDMVLANGSAGGTEVILKIPIIQ